MVVRFKSAVAGFVSKIFHPGADNLDEVDAYLDQEKAKALVKENDDAAAAALAIWEAEDAKAAASPTSKPVLGQLVGNSPQLIAATAPTNPATGEPYFAVGDKSWVDQAPWNATNVPHPPQTILEALAALDKSGGTLYLVHNENGIQYRVVSWSPEDQRAVLEGPHKAILNPRIQQKECAYYTPLWR